MFSNKEIKEISFSEINYPRLLKETKSPPSKIFYIGNFLKNNEVPIALVGTRKATEEGKVLARRVSFDLAKMGFVIVSGLALGIDSEAHRGAIMAGGRTLGVLPCGFNFIYPPSNKKLFSDIIKNNGCLISEYDYNEPPYPSRFLERNRIISGISSAVIIIEAPARSGALATARYASDYGREVFVFPGSIENPNYSGSHFLIRNGATLVTSVSDILNDLEGVLSNYGFKLFTKNNDNLEKRDEEDLIIIQSLKMEKEGLTVDKLSEITHLDIQKVNERLTVLLLENIIEEVNGFFKIKK